MSDDLHLAWPPIDNLRLAPVGKLHSKLYRDMPGRAVFDLVVGGLADQGFERAVIDGKPTLRSASGSECALGLIKPETAEGGHFQNAISELKKLGINLHLLDHLIVAHDDGWTPNQMRSRLRMVAMEHGFPIPASLNHVESP